MLSELAGGRLSRPALGRLGRALTLIVPDPHSDYMSCVEGVDEISLRSAMDGKEMQSELCIQLIVTAFGGQWHYFEPLYIEVVRQTDSRRAETDDLLSLVSRIIASGDLIKVKVREPGREYEFEFRPKEDR